MHNVRKKANKFSLLVSVNTEYLISAKEFFDMQRFCEFKYNLASGKISVSYSFLINSC